MTAQNLKLIRKRLMSAAAHSKFRKQRTNRRKIASGRIAYVAGAAKVVEMLEGSTSATDGHVLLASIEPNVIQSFGGQ